MPVTIQDLPEEILLHIFSYFQLVRKFGTQNQTSSDFKWGIELQEEYDRLAENEVRVRDYYNFSFVSRRWRRVAQPLLFSGLLSFDEPIKGGGLRQGTAAKSAIRFLEAIMRRPELQSYVKYVEVHAVSSERAFWYHKTTEPEEDLKRVRNVISEIVERRKNEGYEDDMVGAYYTCICKDKRCISMGNNPIEAVMGMILALSFNLEHVHLKETRFWLSERRVLSTRKAFGGENHAHHSAHDFFPRCKTISIGSQDRWFQQKLVGTLDPPKQFFPHLKTLVSDFAIEREDVSEGMYENEHVKFDDPRFVHPNLEIAHISSPSFVLTNFVHVLEKNPGLRRLSFRFGTSTPTIETSLRIWQAEKEKRLANSCAPPSPRTNNLEALSLTYFTHPLREIAGITDHSPNLTAFALMVNKDAREDVGMEYVFAELWTAMLEHKERLQYLYIDLKESLYDDNGPGPHMPGLCKFKELKALTIGIKYLFGSEHEYQAQVQGQKTGRVTTLRLVEVLPPKLERLVILQAGDMSDERSEVFFKLADDIEKGALPRLRRLELQSWRTYFRLKDRFEGLGVLFESHESDLKPPPVLEGYVHF